MSQKNNNIDLSEKGISSRFRSKDEIQHVLDRSGTWIGSKNLDVINYHLFKPSENKIIEVKNVNYNAGIVKIIDEIISNSVDEHRSAKRMFDITEIDVEVNCNGECKITDNGGIPVAIHPDYGIYIAEVIFGEFRTSTNYNDEEERSGVGTNGLGSKLTNIFSTKFRVETSDSKKSCIVEWTNNMRDKKLIGVNPSKTHGTTTTFSIELNRFGLETIPMSLIRVIQKRCIDAAAVNPGLIINFKTDVAQGKLDSKWKFDDFDEYIGLFINVDDKSNLIKFKKPKFELVLVPDDKLNIGFVNGASCNAGTHINKIRKQITDKILLICKDQDMELLTVTDINNHMSVFTNITISNPEYDSQTKEKLANKIDNYTLKVSKEFLDNLKDSKIVAELKDFYQIKYAAQKKKELNALNKVLKNTKTKKLIKASAKSDSNELWLFEGNSASNGFRKWRNAIQSAYLLRGKIKNTFSLSRNEIVENVELREIIAALNLLFNEPKKNLVNCKFDKIIIGSDMDVDGNHICGLLLAFFSRHFPELLKAGKVYRALSPIIIAEKKGSETLYYYSLEDYHKVEDSLKSYELRYIKGLGGLTDIDYRQMLRNQKLIRFSMNNQADFDSVGVWFGKSTNMRKQIILDDNQYHEITE